MKAAVYHGSDHPAPNSHEIAAAVAQYQSPNPTTATKIIEMVKSSRKNDRLSVRPSTASDDSRGS